MIRRLQLLAIVLAIFAALGAGASRLKAYATEGGHAWAGNTVPYYVNPANKYISTTAALAAFESSAAAWTGHANVQLSYAGITSDASLSLNYVNEVFFRDDTSALLAETYYWWDGTGHLVDADTVLHENWVWFSSNIGCTNGYYVENTATHEFGHILGMAHSAVATATMWPTSGSCETVRENLDPDDIAGLQSLYPGSSPPPSTAPNAPSQLAVSVNAGAASSSLNVGWVDNASNATGYVVERSADGVTFAQVASLGSNATSYADSGLLASTTYYYRAYAYNSVGASSYSNTASAITQSAAAPPPTSAPSAPSAPSNPSPSNGAGNVSTTVTLGWSDSGATSYDVYFNGNLYTSGISASSVRVSGLGAGQSYSWSVVAKNSVGSTAGPNWSFRTNKKGR